ncbi:MAG TPA: cyclic nucleotide-binding domain-containing protein [Bryobacteraceae bacterium]|nr:cyclic nucleotide-binding domain-containing protein [Bryobacteraceae bacterium]
MTLEGTLRDHGFTRGLSGGHIATLAKLANEVTFAENEVILMQHQHSEDFYLVTSGSVNIELHAPGFTVTVLAVGAGQAFGWSALLGHHETLFQVRARERTAAVRLPGEDLIRACHRDPNLGVEILSRTLQLAAGRIEATEARFAEMCGVRVKLQGH